MKQAKDCNADYCEYCGEPLDEEQDAPLVDATGRYCCRKCYTLEERLGR